MQIKNVEVSVWCNLSGIEYNLSFFKPKKDQCELCTKYSEADAEHNKLQMVAEHVKRKGECQQAKSVDKSEASEKSNVASISKIKQAMPRNAAMPSNTVWHLLNICIFFKYINTIIQCGCERNILVYWCILVSCRSCDAVD